ncbi:MAG TPA: AAA family ATPase [Luteimonas sp.]
MCDAQVERLDEAGPERSSFGLERRAEQRLGVAAAMMSSPEPRPAIRFDRIDQIKPTPLAPVVHDYIFGDTVTGLIGASGACKSFVAGHLACSVGTNTPWFGQGVTQGAVFYLAGEGRSQIVRRFNGWAQYHGVSLEGAPIFLADRLPPLHDRLTAAEVIETIKRIADELFFNSGGIDPSLIVVDTVARALAGADENSASDVGRLVDAFDWLKSQWGCAVLPIHHTGHSQEAKTRGRGSSALYAGLDGEFLVSSDGDTVQLRSMKEKDWPEPMALCLARNVVEVDLGGKVETTLVLSLTDQPRPDEQWFRERVSDLRRDGTPIRTIAEILGATKSKVEHAIRALARDALRYEEAANGR